MKEGKLGKNREADLREKKIRWRTWKGEAGEVGEGWKVLDRL